MGLRELLKKTKDQEVINLLTEYSIIKEEEGEYVPVFAPLEKLTLEEYKKLDKKLKGIVSKDQGNSIVYIQWEERKKGTVIITRKLV